MISAKKIVGYTVTCLYVFSSSFLFHFFISVAFNYQKGFQNNPDGEKLIPFGIIIALLILLIDIIIFAIIVKSANKTTLQKTVFVITLFILIIAAVVLTFDGWKNFIECLIRFHGRFNIS